MEPSPMLLDTIAPAPDLPMLFVSRHFHCCGLRAYTNRLKKRISVSSVPVTNRSFRAPLTPHGKRYVSGLAMLSALLAANLGLVGTSTALVSTLK